MNIVGASRRFTRVSASLAGAFALASMLLLAAPGLAQVESPPLHRFEPTAPPETTARSAFVEDVTSGDVLYSANADERLAMASTTKLMTALVIAQHTTDWQELVTADPSDVLDPSDGESMIGLLAGDVLTVEQMMYGIMLNSGNDAAHAMARVVGGRLLAEEGASGDPVARFVQEMNDTAAALGLTNTHFANPSGLYAADHYTTARELAAIAAAAYAVPIIQTASGTATYEFTSQGANPRVFGLVNTNKLLGQDGVIAGKTGTLVESGACLVVLRNQDGNRVIGVVLGSAIEFDEYQVQIPETDRRFDDMRTLLRSMEQDFTWIRPGDEAFPGLSQELAVWSVRLGDESAVVLPAAAAESLRYLLQLGPPSAPDTPVGNLLIFSADRVVAEKPVLQVA